MPPEQHARSLATELAGLEAGQRHLIAIAGPPGAGKSTLSAPLVAELNALGRKAQVVPMDGFHFDDSILRARGLLPRKGAPETFDAAGFVNLVSRVAAREDEVVYPVFDRSREIAIAGAGVIGAECEFAVFEGNYLLLDRAPWSRLAEYWTRSVYLDVPKEELHARLMQRWLDEGLGEEVARAKVGGNDLPNAELVMAASRPADITLSA